MTQQLQTLADGKLVLVLEGGYEIEPLCKSSELCLRVLLNEKVHLSFHEAEFKPTNFCLVLFRYICFELLVYLLKKYDYRLLLYDFLIQIRLQIELPVESELYRAPCPAAIDSLNATVKYQSNVF